jgi:extradiol dioxygenase family protein
VVPFDALIFVRDLAQLTRFYSEVLGVRPDPAATTDTWVEFDLGGARFGLHAVAATFADGIPVTSPPAARENAAVKLILPVADVARCEEVIRTAGGVALARPWGTSDYADPEGNVFGIANRASR